MNPSPIICLLSTLFHFLVFNYPALWMFLNLSTTIDPPTVGQKDPARFSPEHAARRVLFLGIIWSGWNMRWAPDSGIRRRVVCAQWWWRFCCLPYYHTIMREATFYPLSTRSTELHPSSVMQREASFVTGHRTCNNVWKGSGYDFRTHDGSLT